MKKILIVDEDGAWQNQLSRELKDKATVICAYDFFQAADLFLSTPDLAAIVVDSTLHTEELSTIPLVRLYRICFLGPIIGVASKEEYRQKLKEAGCDFQFDKLELSEKLVQVLGL